MIGAIIGGLPTDPYSQNVGLICTTKVVAKRVFLIVGVIMLAAGFFPKFGALMTTIPQPVLGGATITVFAAITMSGIQLLGEQPMNYREQNDRGNCPGDWNRYRSSTGYPSVLPAACEKHSRKLLMVSFLIVFLLNIIVPEDNSPAS